VQPATTATTTTTTTTTTTSTTSTTTTTTTTTTRTTTTTTTTTSTLSEAVRRKKLVQLRKDTVRTDATWCDYVEFVCSFHISQKMSQEEKGVT